ncbi:hypothetical protein [Maricaulis sp.]|uniref:hypothetical protein n=1 Tax=Maricaulis sp. TaxID=1486257 RepID=UPI003A8E72B2
MTDPQPVPGRLVFDDADVDKPGEFQFLTADWSVTRAALRAHRLELAAPCCGRVMELSPLSLASLAPPGVHRWDGTPAAPTFYTPIHIKPHGDCPGWRGRLEGGEFRPAGRKGGRR